MKKTTFKRMILGCFLGLVMVLSFTCHEFSTISKTAKAENNISEQSEPKEKTDETIQETELENFVETDENREETAAEFYKRKSA